MTVLFRDFCERVQRRPESTIGDLLPSQVVDKKQSDVSVQLADMQCRFLMAMNHLQRVGYLSLGATGNLVRRTLMS